jgi:hypothetical protein
MTDVGGYFGLEVRNGKEFHVNALRLNSGRNAFHYILISKGYEKVYLPLFSCDVLVKPLKASNTQYEYYYIDENFEPIFNFSRIKKNEAFLYINYFGLKDSYISTLKKKTANLIVDNAQAFFSSAQNNVDTFYSPRKFFGVPDGSYLYTNNLLTRSIKRGTSFEQAEHLLRRIDVNARNGYPYFQLHESALANVPILKMSKLTQRILQGIDYAYIANIRRKNFEYLHNALGSVNKLRIEFSKNYVPLVYPFYSNHSRFRINLTAKRIYTPVYWPNVLRDVNKNKIEYSYASYLLHLPIDQRVKTKNLDKIIAIINSNYEH